MADKIKEFLGNYFGEISSEERGEVYAQISAGSSPTKDYFIMLVIAAIIATLGLLTNSVAVIIGAMLVSPLLMPVLGIALGAIKGDIGLFRTAIEAEAKGAAMVIFLVAAITLLVPNAGITSEILLRTHPTPLDMIVALASGAAAAYALSKKSVGVTLPGVAIAVAIMPPLSVVGIGFALRMPEVAFGAALTFISNVVAINFAAILVFWLMGFAPKLSPSTEKETKSRIKTSGVLLILILLPLGWIMYDTLHKDNVRVVIEEVLGAQLDGIPHSRLVDMSFEYGAGGKIIISATIESSRTIDDGKAEEMRHALEKNLKTDVELDLRVDEIKLVRSQPTS